MDDVTQFLIRHGGFILFAVVFAEQIGLPLSAVPMKRSPRGLVNTPRSSRVPTSLSGTIRNVTCT
jgi:hypothetical protein